MRVASRLAWRCIRSRCSDTFGHIQQPMESVMHTTTPLRTASIIEVWHGGIPRNAPTMPRCPLDSDCPSRLGVHSHTVRISDKPFGVAWQTYLRDRSYDLVVHIVGGACRHEWGNEREHPLIGYYRRCTRCREVRQVLEHEHAAEVAAELATLSEDAIRRLGLHPVLAHA